MFARFAEFMPAFQLGNKLIPPARPHGLPTKTPRVIEVFFCIKTKTPLGMTVMGAEVILGHGRRQARNAFADLFDLAFDMRFFVVCRTFGVGKPRQFVREHGRHIYHYPV